MAALWLLMQPIVPAMASNCTGDADIGGHMIALNDTQDVQFQVFPCEGADTIFSDISYLAGTWTENLYTSKVCAVAGNTGSYAANFLTNYNRFFEIKFIITDYVSGVLEVAVTGGEIFFFESPGTYTIYSQAPPAAFITITASSSSFIGCFSTVIEVIPMPVQYKMVLYNSDNVGVYTFTDFDIDGNWVTFHNDMTLVPGLVPGCYYFGILDPCVNTCFQNYVPGQYFDVLGVNVNHWSNLTSPDEWEVVVPGQATIETTVNGGYSYINDTEFCLGQYRVCYDIVGLGAGNSFRATLGTFGIDRTAPGSYCEIFTVSTLAGIQNQLILNCGMSNVLDNEGFVTIENLRIERLSSFTVPDQQSQPYSVGNVGAGCMIKLQGCVTGEAFGFNFENFNPMMRISGSVDGPQYQTDGNIFRYKSGRKDVNYWDVLKNKSLTVAPAREYVHDFLSIWRGFDSSFVNGVKVVMADVEYPDLDWQKNCVAAVEFPIESNPSKVRKVRCTEQSACLIVEENFDKIFQDAALMGFQSGPKYAFQ